MTKSAPVEKVVEFLVSAGFQELPTPLVIRQSRFEFPAVMMGPGNASDIVLVSDTVNAKDADIVRKIQGVARALDLARSRNPLTSVLVGPRPIPGDLTKMMQVCRVLPVGTVPTEEKESKEHLSNWLAVLTPLNQIHTDGVVADPMAELISRLGDLSPEVQALCNSVPSGTSAVEEAANNLLAEALRSAWENEA